MIEEVLESLPAELVEVFQKFEYETINDLARRINKTLRYTATYDYMVTQLKDLGYSEARISREVMKAINSDAKFKNLIAENTKAFNKSTGERISVLREETIYLNRETIAKANSEIMAEQNAIYKEAGYKLVKPKELPGIITEMITRSRKDLINLTNTKAIGFTRNGVFQPLASVYQKELSLALTKTTTGVYTYQQAVNDAVKNLSKSGVTHIDFASGVKRQVDTAVRNSVLTSSSQLTGQITDANIKEMGVEWVEASYHAGSRPSHARWQGKIYTYDEFVKECGYGKFDADSIYGYNCRHIHYPFFKGISEPQARQTEPKPVKVGKKEYTYYDSTQKQRQMEREIRATKREINGQKAIDGDISELNARLKKQRHDYKNFSKEVGISEKPNRLTVYKAS